MLSLALDKLELEVKYTYWHFLKILELIIIGNMMNDSVIWKAMKTPKRR